MYRFIQKNNKKLLAVFAAFLMVVFILPSTMNQMGGGGADPVLAKIGDEELHASAFQQAEQEWRMLSELRAGPQTRFGGGALPFTYRLGWNEMSEFQLMQGAPPVPVNAIMRNPRMYLLLQREAQRMGIGIAEDRVQDIMINELAGMQPPDKQSLERLRRAIANFLLVQVGFERASSVIKVSQPAVRHEVARRMQNVIVNVVEVPAAAYAEKVPAPTTQQLQAQFDKYKDVDPQVIPKENPFGFGYRYPNRVKLQYITVPREDVRKMVEASKSEYEWEVEAQKYYLQNQSQFPTTQASDTEALFSLAGPTTASTRSATTQAARATTRPFAEVKDDAKSRVLIPEVERRATEIQNRIAAIMAADYVAFRNASPNASAGATQPAGAPNSSQGVPYNSYDYLQRLAQTIQRDFKVLPTVAAFDDKLRDAKELATLERIGATTESETGASFADYATNAAEAFRPAERREDPAALALYEPSRVLRDIGNNVYLVRLTAADPAHAPASIAEVADAVRNDVIAAAAFEQAKADATKLLDQAKQSGIKRAAQSAQKNVLTVGPFPSDVRGKLPGLELKDDASSAVFAAGAFDLLSTPPPRDGAKPVALIEVAKEGKVYVAELADVQQRQQMSQSGASPAAEIERGMLAELERGFENQWYNFDDVKKRLNYAATELSNREDRQQPSPNTPLPRPLPL
ncbi:MAG: SurA N-terminal domain-containing protein [Planctomycetota bacterium]|nr:SurA N-terminal domain-containing protein [Planctomycetota bacterium]